MQKRELQKFFNPKSIAIIGASTDVKKVGGILLEKNKNSKAKIIPINPKYSEINKLKCYPSVDKVPSEIDLAIIATPIESIINILNSCIKKKIKNIIIITAGFAEINNNLLQNKITLLAKKNKINLLGPNCFGIFNPNLNLDLTFSNTTPKKGNIAFISQSGALWSYVSDLNLKFSGFVSLGNMADLNFNDWLEYFIKDKNTKKIILYIEKLTEGRKFIDLCKKTNKEIVAIKAGQTKKGIKATISHTASIATDYRIYKGAFEQAEIKQTESIAIALGLVPNKINLIKRDSKIITNAGGAEALLTDTLTKKGFKISQLTDILGTATAENYEKQIKKLEKENYKGNIVVILTPQRMSEPEKTAKILIESKLKKNIFAFFLGKKSIEKARNLLLKNRISVITKI